MPEYSSTTKWERRDEKRKNKKKPSHHGRSFFKIIEELGGFRPKTPKKKRKSK